MQSSIAYMKFILPIGFTFYLLMHFFLISCSAKKNCWAQRKPYPALYTMMLMLYMVGSKREHINCCRLSDDSVCLFWMRHKFYQSWSEIGVSMKRLLADVNFYHDVFYEYVESNRSRSAHAYHTVECVKFIYSFFALQNNNIRKL